MIKTKLILTAKATILVIDGLPEDTIIISRPHKLIWYLPEDIYWTNGINLPPGKWQPLGFLDKIPEEVAKELVDIIPIGGYARADDKDHFYDYSQEKSYVTSSTEALRSLVEANCKLENGYGEYPTKENTGLDYGMEYLGGVDMWETEEEKVFRNPYLLKKIN